MVTGEGEADLRDSLNHRLPPMSARHNTRFFVDEAQGTVIAFALLRLIPTERTQFGGSGKGDTAHLAERFKIVDGKIKEIEAIVYLETGNLEGVSGWQD